MLRIGIMGSTGYTGEELIKVLLKHPKVKITVLARRLDKPLRIDEISPQFKGRIDLLCEDLSPDEIAKRADFIFLALPHKVSMDMVPAFRKHGKKIIDLSADYRFDESSIYEKWYGILHKDEKYLKDAVYGLPELYRKKISKAMMVANPGCYPTSAILGAAPLLKEGIVELNSIIIDSKSGVSGAGKTPSLSILFSEVNESLKAYKINQHQHSPEIEQELSKLNGGPVSVTFVPHLVPMTRGILSTIYMKISHQSPVTSHKIIECYKKFYKDEPFVRISPEGSVPEIKDVANTNYCDIGITVDEKKKLVIVISCIDNLLKGASGQAVQNMNIMEGFKETEGFI